MIVVRVVPVRNAPTEAVQMAHTWWAIERDLEQQVPGVSQARYFSNLNIESLCRQHPLPDRVRCRRCKEEYAWADLLLVCPPPIEVLCPTEECLGRGWSDFGALI